MLRGLWEEGSGQTVRELHERLSPEWDVGYTTILKLLQRMHDKGLVVRRSEGRAHVYRAAIREAATERRLVRDLAARAFGGSVERLVQRALPAEAASPAELQAIRRLLARLEGGEQGKADEAGKADETGKADEEGASDGAGAAADEGPPGTGGASRTDPQGRRRREGSR